MQQRAHKPRDADGLQKLGEARKQILLSMDRHQDSGNPYFTAASCVTLGKSHHLSVLVCLLDEETKTCLRGLLES